MSYRTDGQDEDRETEPSFVKCLAVVLSGPIGLGAVTMGVSGAGWLIGVGGLMLFLWSMYQWHKAIAGYYS